MDLNRVLGRSLRAGVLAGALLSGLGLVVWAGKGFPNVNPAPASSLLEVVRMAFSGDIAGVIYLGVFVLVATPFFRVAVSSFHFGLEKDWKYVAVTLLVLGMLVFALFAQTA